MTLLINRKTYHTTQLVPKKRDWSMVGNEKFRIVAFDDDNDILDLIRMTLSEQYEVITTNDPIKAAELLELVEPEIVILDVMMPKVTGYQIAESIRRTPQLQHTLIMFLSAKDTPRDVKYGYKLGANFYITKPFQPDRLQRTLEALVQEHYPSGKPRPKVHPIGVVKARILASKAGSMNAWQAHQAQQLLGTPQKPVEEAPRPGQASSSRNPRAVAPVAPSAPPPSSGTHRAAPSILPPEDPDGEGSGLGRKNWVD